MGNNKPSSSIERKLIWKTFQRYENIAKVKKILGISRGRINNAISYYKKRDTFENVSRKKMRKTISMDDRCLVRVSKPNPFLTSNEIRAELEEHYGVKISAQTV